MAQESNNSVKPVPTNGARAAIMTVFISIAVALVPVAIGWAFILPNTFVSKVDFAEFRQQYRNDLELENATRKDLSAVLQHTLELLSAQQALLAKMENQQDVNTLAIHENHTETNAVIERLDYRLRTLESYTYERGQMPPSRPGGDPSPQRK